MDSLASTTSIACAVDAAPERRIQRRRRVIKGGKVVFNNGQSVIDCSVRDLSEGGAKLLLRDPIILPHDFQLQMLDGRLIPCELRWARNGAVGVKFRGA